MVEICEKLKFLVRTLQHSLSLHIYEYMGQGEVVPVYTMKAYRGSTSICPLKLISGRKPSSLIFKLTPGAFADHRKQT
jgi:hypothetical protein